MPKVLVVDDNTDARRVIRLMLESAGYEVAEAENGVECIREYQAGGADVVVLDMFMPEKDGLETLQDLRRITPAVRVLAISGGGISHHTEILQPASLMGANRTLMKPFSRDELLANVAGLLSSASKEAAPAPARGAQTPNH